MTTSRPHATRSQPSRPRPRLRRVKGTGSIVERADGRIEVRFPKAGGGYTYRAAPDRPAAERVLATLLLEAEKPRQKATATMPVADFLRQWLTTVIEPSHPTGTVVNYRTHLEKRIIPIMGSVPLGELDGTTIQQWIATLVRRRYAPSTVRVARNVLGTALTCAAEDWRLIPYNPMPRRGLPKVRRRTPPEWTPERAQAILGAVTGTRVWGPTALLLLSGSRQGEVLGLRRAEDLSEAAISVQGQLERRTLRHVPPKTEWAVRTLPLTPLAVAVIAAQPVRGPWLFGQDDGRPLTHNQMSKTYEAALRAAEIAQPGPLHSQGLHIHGLRHGTISLLRALGVDDRTRQAIVGHAPEGVHGRYTHTTAAAVQEALERLSALLMGDTVAEPGGYGGR